MNFQVTALLNVTLAENVYFVTLFALHCLAIMRGMSLNRSSQLKQLVFDTSSFAGEGRP